MVEWVDGCDAPICYKHVTPLDAAHGRPLTTDRLTVKTNDGRQCADSDDFHGEIQINSPLSAAYLEDHWRHAVDRRACLRNGIVR